MACESFGNLGSGFVWVRLISAMKNHSSPSHLHSPQLGSTFCVPGPLLGIGNAVRLGWTPGSLPTGSAESSRAAWLQGEQGRRSGSRPRTGILGLPTAPRP